MRRTHTFQDSKTGKPVIMECRLNIRGQFLLFMTQTLNGLFRWLPPEDGFKEAMKRNTLFRLNGGPWIKYPDFERDYL